MLKKLTFFYFFLTAFTTFFYSDFFMFKEGVYFHGMVGILGFALNAYLSIVVNEKNFKVVFDTLQKIYFYLSIILITLICFKLYVLITIVSFVYFIFTIPMLLRYDPDYVGLEKLFIKSSIYILLLDWVYFMYSLNYNTFFGMKTKFSYNYLSFSFPLSLILFSEFVKFLKMKKKEIVVSVIVLVGGVLTMFIGMLLNIPIIELSSAGILLLLIFYYFVKSGKINDKFLFFNYMGLLLTGIFGFWYLYTVIAGVSDKVILLLHAHFAHYTWATFGLFYLFVKNVKKRIYCMANLLLSLVCLSVYLIKPYAFLLYISFCFFVISGLIALFAFLKNGVRYGFKTS
ncbi:hypothetical protein FHQ18_01975 [Deferribacter autotrophicus]|uniref:Uncharacterized protein n=1 Tax=Deferribacter autotrophicus TaxID=500465 RepID=A0A5A8F5E4_9BACT|nr:hypothetical protein [Deferribacter autotrophicus]KAA0259242.1 hypothetical protein FHQ18_01975 [Deferribacter autotrophicus]